MLPIQASTERLGAASSDGGIFEMPMHQQTQIPGGIQAQMAFQNVKYPAPVSVSIPTAPTGAADRKTETVNGDQPKEGNNTAAGQNPSNTLGAIVSLKEIATPGFTDKVSQQDLLSTAKNLYGEQNCYATLQNVSVSGDIPISTNEFATVGSTITSALSSIFASKKKASARKSFVSDINTAFEPGKLCLVIGAPSSGKSSLLKYISGRLDDNLDVEGKLRFNGIEVAQNMVPRVSLYVPQTDSHTPVLTVEETLNFSYDCQTRPYVTGMHAAAGIDLKSRPKVEFLLHTLGLKNCKDTVVGNGNLRGVSGGEKKRVTSAEMMLGSQMVLCLDEISTGLDSAATYDIIKALRLHCHELKTTTTISLLQPPPEVFELFDDVLVMGAGGHMIYHGPTSQVRDYFTNELGFHCPPHIEFADFLVDVCTDDAKAYYQQNAQYGHFAPDCNEMASRWKRSDLCHSYIVPRFGQAGAFGQDGVSNVVNKAPHTSEFGASMLRLFWLNLVRHLRVLSKDRQLIRQRVMQNLIQGIMLGTIFWQEENNGLKIAMLFIFIALNSMGNLYIIEIAAHKREVFYKHRNSNFYPTLAYTFSELIAEVPQVIVEVCLLGTVTFWFAGFTPSTFPTFVITLILSALFFLTFFKTLVASTSTAPAAHGIAIGCMAVTFCFSGFLVTKSSIPDYFIWLYWITPFSWLLRLLCINEFGSSGRDGEYDALVRAGNQDKRAGDLFLESFSMETDDVWIMYGLLYLIVGLVIFFITYTYNLHYKRFGDSKPMVVKNEKKRTFSLHPANLKKKSPFERLPSEEFLKSASAAAFDDDASGIGNFDGPYDTLRSLSVQPEPITLSLKQLSYTVQVPVKGKREPEGKLLLNEVSAMFVPGTMTALMGSSGAGKSTLMDVIAGRKNTGKVSGELLVNGHSIDNATFARVSGYVEQADIHVPTETVHEALRFSAYHRLPREMPDAEKESVVEAVVDLIELRPILNKVIGHAGGGSLSVEQRKRVTIGVEMAANPSVLFLDEPTSGLDSRSARVVMRAVRRIAASGRTVLCTIHQPSYEIFSMFDRLLLLKKGGWVVYNGDMGPTQHNDITNEPINTAQNMVNYFRSCSTSVPPLAEDQNPAEYMLSVIGAGTSAGNGQAAEHGVDFVECYQRSAMAVSINQMISTAPQGQKLHFATRYSASYTRQISLNIRRWMASYWRNVSYNLTRNLVVILCSLLFGLSITKQRVSETYDQPTLQSFNGAIFAAVFFTCAIQAVMSVGVIGDSKQVLYREQSSGMYARWVYLLALSVAEVPWLLGVTGLQSLIFYPLAHLHTDPAYVTQYVVSLFLFANMFNHWGQMLSALLPTTQAASLLTGASMGTMNLYSGFFMPESTIPWPWKLLFYISPARFGLKATMPSQFYCSLSCFADQQDGSMPIECNGPGSESIRSLADAPFNGSGPGCALMTDSTGVIGQTFGLEYVAENLGVSPMGDSGRLPPLRLTVWDYWSKTTESSRDDVWEYTGGLLGFLVAFRIITLLALTYLKHVKR